MSYEMRYTNFHRFGDVVIDTQELVMLTDGNVVVLTDGTQIGVGKEAADAIRSYFTPASDRKTEPSGSTSDEAQAAEEGARAE